MKINTFPYTLDVKYKFISGCIKTIINLLLSIKTFFFVFRKSSFLEIVFYEFTSRVTLGINKRLISYYLFV